MAAYLVADVEVTDPPTYDEYRKGVAATIAAYGGRFIVRGGATRLVEGDRKPARLVILEFPSMERLEAWYRSPEYRPLLAMRERSAKSNVVMVEGV